MLVSAALASCGPSGGVDASAVADAAQPDAARSGSGAMDAGQPDGGTRLDGGPPDSGPTDAEARDARVADAGAAEHAGVALLTHVYGQFVVGAEFAEATSVDTLLEGTPPASCLEIRTEGNCRVVDCSGATTLVSAGVLTAKVNGTTVASVAPVPPGGYLRSGTSRVFEDGDVVELEAAGDVVPAFALATTAPAALAATLPTMIDRTTPLVLTWSAATRAELARVVLLQGQRRVLCIGPDVGSRTVPGSLLGELDPGTAATLTLTIENTTIARIGEWDIAAVAAESVLAAVTVE